MSGFLNPRAKGSAFDLDIDADEVETGLKFTKKNVPKAVGLALYKAAVQILIEAGKLTPVDTGQLKRSRFATKPFLVQGGPFVILGYSTRYAVFVHEATWIPHSPGRSKYLQKAIANVSGDIGEKIARWAWDNLEAGRGLVLTPRSKFPSSPPQ